MKHFTWIFLVLYSAVSFAQQGFTYETQQFNTARAAVYDFSEKEPQYEPKLLLIKAEHPAPLSNVKKLKAALDAQRALFVSGTKHHSVYDKTGATAPSLLTSFSGNATQGTPNDNDLAVSNDGKIISVANSNLNMYKDSAGAFLMSRTLSAFANKLGSLDRTYDPRVIYDPVKDRFIVVFLQGSSSTDTRIIVAFSQTNDPTKQWNFYAIPGNVFGDSSWSDYPIISLTNDELFITVNRLKDNTSFQLGFIESLIWQVDKQKGYDGDSLKQQVYKNIKLNGKSIWSICPAKGGAALYGPNMYFLSMRPADLDNDTVFLHEITNTIASGQAQLKLTVLKTDVHYGLGPNAIQPSGKRLQTNDARALCAMFEQDKIHFVGNCIDTSNFSASVYYGMIDHVSSAPVVTGRILSYDTMDIGYPAIAYAGGGGPDKNSSIITFSYTSPRSFPGTAAIFVDRDENMSSPVVIKGGLGSVHLLADSVERWGDYTGNQRKYNELGVCWINGSFGGTDAGNHTWIAKLKSTDPLLGNKEIDAGNISGTILYPNPAKDYAAIEFTMKETMMVEFDLLDINGKLIAKLLRDKAKAGLNRFSIATADLKEGTYIINIVHDNTVIEHKKLLVVH